MLAKSKKTMDGTSTKTGMRAFLRTELPGLVLLVAALFAARSSLADHYYVPSGSMEHTLYAGDRVFVNKMAYGLRLPFTRMEIIDVSGVERGDVVIFDSPRDGVRLIKRIVGIGGDRISVNDGHLFVNGDSQATGVADIERIGDQLVSLNLSHGGGPDLPFVEIPRGMVLAVGDHRGRSLDGRIFGLVPESEIYGKALGVYRRKGEGFVWRAL